MIALLALWVASAHAVEPLGYEAWVRQTAWTTPELEAEAHAKRTEALERLGAIVTTLEGQARAELELRMGQMLLDEGLASESPELLERAAAAFEAVLQDERQAARDEALLGRGRALHALGQDEQAIALLQRLLEKDPPSTWVPEATAVLAEAGPESRRRELLVQAADHRGTAAAWAHYRLGWLDHDAGAHVTERLHLGAAIELHPGAMVVIADAMDFMHAYELSPMPDPVTYVEVEPCPEPTMPSPKAWVQLAWCLYDQHEMERAEQALTKLKMRFGRGSGWWRHASREERREIRRYIKNLEKLL